MNTPTNPQDKLLAAFTYLLIFIAIMFASFHHHESHDHHREHSRKELKKTPHKRQFVGAYFLKGF